MESWREELYRSLRHSVEGSTWKDHKYIDIVDGRYIYPEDVQNRNKYGSSVVNNTKSSTTTSATITPPTNPKKVKKQKDKDGKEIEVTDKGSVKDYRYLPKDPAIGDMYLLEDTKRYCYWDGKIWTPIDESGSGTAATTTVAPSGGGYGYTGDIGNLTEDTIERVRSVSSGINLLNARTVKLNPDTTVSSLSGSQQVANGRSSIKDALSSLANKAISAIKSTKIYQAGVSLVNRIRGNTVSLSVGARR